MTLMRGTDTGGRAAAGGRGTSNDGGVRATGMTSGEAGAEPEAESGGEGATLRLD